MSNSIIPAQGSIFSVDTGGGGGGGGDTITSPNNTISIGGTATNTTVDINLGHSNTFTVAQGISAAGTVSTAVFLLSGNIFTGGTGTTTLPLFYINNGTAPTTWSTNGTYIGANAITGFIGNFIDFRVNGGGSMFQVSVSGAIIGNNTIAVTNQIQAKHFDATQPPLSLNGTTSGTISYLMPMQGTMYKVFIANAAAYVNNTAGNQTITFPVAFTNIPGIHFNETGLALSVSTTTLTIIAPNNATTYSGNITIVGW